ncbi:MAG: DUF4238 domain-containing protein [Cyanobacteria bacterium HKST-UBA01]|nr:DUF4238 domain-containing protein [Cyanobacteria bacterium HKST-UBA01]
MLSIKPKLQTTKNQHIVPKCFLKRWCDDEGRIHAYRLEGGFKSRSSPKSAATRVHVYDTLSTLNPEDPENYQIFEKTFGIIENEIPEVFDSILSNARRAQGSILIPTECTRISDEIASKLIRLAVVQFLRDTRFRDRAQTLWNDWLQQAWDQTVPKMFESDEELDVFFESVSEHFLTEWLIDYLKDRLLRFSEIIEKKTLVIGLNKTTKCLLTSDSPVHWIGPYIDASQHWDGINSRSSRMVYPLAPDVCAIFYDPTYYADQRPYHRCVRVLNHREVEEFNYFMTLQSERQIFSCDGDFSHAEFALSQEKIAGRKLAQKKSTPIPKDLIALIEQAAYERQWSKREWKAYLQFEGSSSVLRYKSIQEQLLNAFDGPRSR